MKNNIRLKIRDLVRRGGSRNYSELKIESPQVTATSTSDKLGGNIAKQAEMDSELVEMNKKLAGGGKDDVVVPQFSQGGASANSSVKQQIGSTLQGSADGEFDQQVLSPDQAEAASQSTVGRGGRRKRKTKRRKRKKKRKTKRRKRKSRRKSKRKRRRTRKRRK